MVRFQRVMIVVVGILAYLLARASPPSCRWRSPPIRWSGRASAPALLAAFLWRRVTAAGGTASIAAGMLVDDADHVAASGSLSAWLSGSWGRPVDVTEYMIYPSVVASIAVSDRSQPADAALAATALEALLR